MLYTTEKIHPQVTRIWDVSHTACYLIEGDEEAVLVDSGIGAGSLKAAISGLTDKPVTVLLTHGHLDHAMGAAGFDRVYLNPADRELLNLHGDVSLRMGYVSGAAAMGSDPAVIAGVTAADYLPAIPAEQTIPLEHDMVFDLGGLHVRALSCTGHTPGSMVMLIEELRMLILGDACNSYTYLFDPKCPTIEQYRENLIRLQAQTEGKYDRTLFSHGVGEGAPTMLANVIAVCDDILAGSVDNAPFHNPTVPSENAVIAKEMDFQRFCRVDGGEGNVVYCPARIR